MEVTNLQTRVRFIPVWIKIIKWSCFIIFLMLLVLNIIFRMHVHLAETFVWFVFDYHTTKTKHQNNHPWILNCTTLHILRCISIIFYDIMTCATRSSQTLRTISQWFLFGDFYCMQYCHWHVLNFDIAWYLVSSWSKILKFLRYSIFITPRQNFLL